MRIDKPDRPQPFFNDKPAECFPFFRRVTTGIKNGAFPRFVVDDVRVFSKRIEFEYLYLCHDAGKEVLQNNNVSPEKKNAFLRSVIFSEKTPQKGI